MDQAKKDKDPIATALDVTPIEGEVVPIDKSLISGLVPSFAVAKTNLSPLSVVPNVTDDPEPVAYLNCTVCAPDVVFLNM